MLRNVYFSYKPCLETHPGFVCICGNPEPLSMMDPFRRMGKDGSSSVQTFTIILNSFSNGYILIVWRHPKCDRWRLLKWWPPFFRLAFFAGHPSRNHLILSILAGKSTRYTKPVFSIITGLQFDAVRLARKSPLWGRGQTISISAGSFL